MKTVPTETEEEKLPVVETRETGCCIVGGGPGGAVLALLLARRNVPVVLLEAHDDFDRDFRGDTLHPSVMEIMDQLGLADGVLQIRHSEIRKFSFATPDGPVTLADLGRLDTKFPFIAMVPQSKFLEFITAEAKRYPHFQLTMGARVEELIKEDGVVRGVRYREEDGWHEVRATLTVGADGRGSRLRHLTGMEPVKTSPPMDVLWFRLPRFETDAEGAMGRFSRGRLVIMLDRLDEWQMGYVIFKGSYKELRAKGIEAFREALAEAVPELGERVRLLTDWKQVAILSVESSRMKRWHIPGLLLIGDAAHVMSPIGGVGINYAIQDATVAHNVLARPLLAGKVEEKDLAEVQRRRERPTRVIQRFQTIIQKRVIAAALRAGQNFRLPLVMRLLLKIPGLRDIPGRLIAFGLTRVRVED
jgi:2-polyprenyl-6-methoxyphenol hydroxylase-like FAD-dependent oxidoreductase